MEQIQQVEQSIFSLDFLTKEGMMSAVDPYQGGGYDGDMGGEDFEDDEEEGLDEEDLGEDDGEGEEGEDDVEGYY